MIFAIALPPQAAPAALGLAAGIALGLIHFATLRRVSTLMLSGSSPGRVILLQLVRFAALAVALAALARAGAVPLLAGGLGVLLSRAVILQRLHGET